MGDDSATSPPAKIDIQSMSFAGLASRSLQEAYGSQEGISARGRSETEGKISEKEKKHSLTRRMTGDLGNKLIRKGSVSDNDAKKERKQRKKEQKQKEKEEKKKEKEEKNKDKKGLLRMPRKGSTPKRADGGGGVATNGGTQPTEAPKIFKCSLEDVMAHQADKPELKIPIVLQVLTDAVMRLGGGHTEGLFRVPGDATEIQFLKNQLNEKDYEIKSNDPNVVAGVLKLWFRELKPPLLIPEIYDECLINASKPDVLQKVIDEQLPEINKNVVYFTLKWLRMLAKEEYSSKTMMGIENLAMVFAPAFLRCPKTAIMMFNAAKEKEVVECLLKHTCYGPDEKSPQQVVSPREGGGERGAPPPLPALPPNLSTAGGAPSPGGGFRNRLMAKFGDAVPPPAAATPGEEAQQQPPQQQEQLPQPALTSPVEETQQPQQRTNPPPLPTLPPTAVSGLASAVSQSEGAPTNKFGRPAFAPQFGKSLAKFDFKAIDKDGNSLADRLDDLDISLVGPDGKEMGCKVEPQPDDVGLFFQPALPGDYKISIFYNKEHISGSPFVTEVGSSSLDIFVNSVTVFRFNATKTRESGKAIPATTPATAFQLNIVGPEDKDVEGTIAEAGEGLYDVSWRPYAPGLYTIFIFFENETVQGSPFRVTIAQGGEGGGSSFLPQLNATGAGGV